MMDWLSFNYETIQNPKAQASPRATSQAPA